MAEQRIKASTTPGTARVLRQSENRGEQALQNLLSRDRLQPGTVGGMVNVGGGLQLPTHQVVVICNKLAMTALSTENFKECHMFLKRAEALLDRQPPTEQLGKLNSLTMNNLGCYYKKIQKPNVALKYMKKALKNDIDLERALGKPIASTIASTKLNICAILSLLGKHIEALGYVKSAIYDYNMLLEKRGGSDETIIPGEEEINYFSLLQSLSIAYFNEGVENEHLKEQTIDFK